MWLPSEPFKLTELFTENIRGQLVLFLALKRTSTRALFVHVVEGIRCRVIVCTSRLEKVWLVLSVCIPLLEIGLHIFLGQSAEKRLGELDVLSLLSFEESVKISVVLLSRCPPSVAPAAVEKPLIPGPLVIEYDKSRELVFLLVGQLIVGVLDEGVGVAG